MKLMTRRETCPTCAQQIVPPTPSKVILVRVAMAAFAVGSGLLEYRRTVRRELEQRQLEQLHDTSPDVPLDEHLDQRDPGPPVGGLTIDSVDDGPFTHTMAGPITPTPWPPSHPSLADEHDASGADQ